MDDPRPLKTTRPARARTMLPLGLFLLGALFLAGSARAQDGPGPTGDTAAGRLVLPGPATGSTEAVRALLYARPFTLEEPYSYLWSAEDLAVRAGFILVLEVDPEHGRPRQTEMPVLYAGARPVEIANGDSEAGRVVALAPGPPDLSTEPIFYGSTLLPERVDRIRGAAELSAARALGIGPRGREELERALSAGGPPLTAESIDDVYRALADVLAVYSPGEADRIASYRLIP